MALTKVTGQVVKTDTDLTVGVITAVTATFTGNVSVAGTLTYDDVTNVDSVGLITARSGIDITGGGGLNLTGGAGIITATRYRVGTAATLDASGLSVSAGVVTATTYRVGTAATLDASGLSVSAGVVTATTYRVGTATTLDASGLSVSAGVVTTTTLRIGGGSAAAPSITPTGDTDTGIFFPSADTIAFGEGGSEAARIDSSGRFGIGSTSVDSAAKAAISNGGAEGFEFRAGNTAGVCEIVTYNRSGSAYTDFRYDASTHQWKIGGNEKARLDASGRFLVGTTSTSANCSLVLEGFDGGTADTDGILRLHRKTTTPADGAGLGNISFATSGTSGFTAAAYILGQRDGGTWTNGSSHPGRLVFATTANGAISPTERMRINRNGQVLIGTTDVGYGSQSGFTFDGGVSASYQTISHANASASGSEYVAFGYNGGLIGSIAQSGTTAVAYNTTSDYRLKGNVTAVTDGITRLQQLKPSRFNFIADPGRTVDGFIAHEVQTVVPEAITGEKDEVDDDDNPVYQGIDQSKLVPLLTAALQEAVAKIESLEARLTALESA